MICDLLCAATFIEHAHKTQAKGEGKSRGDTKYPDLANGKIQRPHGWLPMKPQLSFMFSVILGFIRNSKYPAKQPVIQGSCRTLCKLFHWILEQRQTKLRRSGPVNVKEEVIALCLSGCGSSAGLTGVVQF
uniref:Uncharacterized protein n=1 Tax=Rousettus aegyptiacus TaxID=9407 RepID=A0A7J8F1A2_ROUAE|nr:hypothetical protein HJG63_012258 [Rousettus aegyptiacus]